MACNRNIKLLIYLFFEWKPNKRSPNASFSKWTNVVGKIFLDKGNGGENWEHWFANFTATGSLAHCFALCISWNKPKSIQKKKKKKNSKNRSLCWHNISRELIILIEISVPLDIFDSLFFGFLVSITIKLINNLTTVFNDTWSPDSSSLA